MDNAQRLATRVVVGLILVMLLTTVGFVTSVAAQSVDDVQTTLTDEDGDGMEDRIEIQTTVSDVGTGRTVVKLEGDFNFNVSPTDTEDGSQAQFVTFDEEANIVEFVEVGTADGTYTVVADLSNHSVGETGTVAVWVGPDGRADANDRMSNQFEIGGNTDGSDQDGGTDENENQSEVDGGSSTDDTGGEGMPGFTAVAVLFAFVLTAVYHKRR